MVSLVQYFLKCITDIEPRSKLWLKAQFGMLLMLTQNIKEADKTKCSLVASSPVGKVRKSPRFPEESHLSQIIYFF